MNPKIRADMTEMALDVHDFQEKVQDLPYNDEPKPLSPDRFAFRLGHMKEELQEYVEAYGKGDVANQADALIDLVYVALGAVLEMGIDPMVAFSVVHKANMEKTKGETKRAHSGGYDAVKPEGWKAPDLDGLLERLRLRAKVPPSLLEATALSVSKSQDYNSSVPRTTYFPFGHTSYCHMIWTKALRARNLVESRTVPNHESLRDTLLDIINYASYWVDEHIDAEGKNR